ncbi:methylase involved in ubiquinone/menaquinone biosynthesis [Clostridium sp. CAG:226]|nr:methylase involved in ubiquinone/menaquinone biosynthesis [Clostridium sp. CAG:226]
MTIYKDAELKMYLEQAGFHDVQIHKNEKGWLCILVQKQQYAAEGIKYSERDI